MQPSVSEDPSAEPDVAGESEIADKPALDAFHRHEVLHLASVVADLFEREVEQHRYTQADAKLATAAGKAADGLRHFYQLVGAR